MTQREQIVECMEALENGMCRVKMTRDIWQNDLIYVLCYAVKLLLTIELKRKGDQK